MVFGEFEWQTSDHIRHQVEVNLLGTVLITQAFMSMIRKHKSRVINVTSHCAIEALNGASIYAATKAGIKAWNDAIRIELKNHGVKVISFIPGEYPFFKRS